MKHITFYFDFVSPYAWLAFEKLPQLLQGRSHIVTYRPVLLGAILKHHDNPGPANIAPKRAWVYRHCAWHAQQMGLDFEMPQFHPFRSVELLRLALACGHEGTVSRHVVDAMFRHIWQRSAPTPQDALDPARLQALQNTLKLQHDPTGDEVKSWLRHNTDQAVRAGVFGVPAFELEQRIFWGLEGMDMLLQACTDDTWLREHWDAPQRVTPQL